MCCQPDWATRCADTGGDTALGTNGHRHLGDGLSRAGGLPSGVGLLQSTQTWREQEAGRRDSPRSTAELGRQLFRAPRRFRLFDPGRSIGSPGAPACALQTSASVIPRANSFRSVSISLHLPCPFLPPLLALSLWRALRLHTTCWPGRGHLGRQSGCLARRNTRVSLSNCNPKRNEHTVFTKTAVHKCSQ